MIKATQENINTAIALVSILYTLSSGIKSCSDNDKINKRITYNSCVDELNGFSENFSKSYEKFFTSINLYDSRRNDSFLVRLINDYDETTKLTKRFKNVLKKHACDKDTISKIDGIKSDFKKLVDSVMANKEEIAYETYYAPIIDLEKIDFVQSCCK